MSDNVNTIQSNIKNSNTRDMTKYSLFLGGMNVSSKSIEQYDPLKTGYNRLFLVKKPIFLDALMPDKTKQFKHIMEYGFLGIDGIQNITLDFESITGGYAGRTFELPTVAKDDTNSITVKLQEFSGSPIREYIDMWITGIADPNTGIAHYHGALDKYPDTVKFGQFYHSAEAIVVATDPTGLNVEFASLLTNMVPKQVKQDHFNYESGTHSLVQYDIEFTTTAYKSIQINEIAKALIKKYKIMRDYLKFDSGYTQTDVDDMAASNIQDWKSIE